MKNLNEKQIAYYTKMYNRMTDEEKGGISLEECLNFFDLSYETMGNMVRNAHRMAEEDWSAFHASMNACANQAFTDSATRDMPKMSLEEISAGWKSKVRECEEFLKKQRIEP